MFDIAIIGAGIIGSLLVYELSKYNVSVVLIDKESDSCNGVSSANSAIIHAGYDPENNTLKALFNVKGNQLYPQLCQELKARYYLCGGIVVAKSEEELDYCNHIELKAIQRKIPYQKLTKEELLHLQPNLNHGVVGGILFPTTAVIYPWEVCQSAVETAILNGAETRFDQKVVAISKSNDIFTITTTKQSFQSKVIINAAGLSAHIIEQMVSPPTFTVDFRKGEYYVLDKKAAYLTKQVIYPVPNKISKGVLIVPTLDGNILIGPNSVDIEDAFDNSTSLDGLQQVKIQADTMLNNIPYHLNIRNFSGVRATSSHKDFIIEQNKHVKNFFNIAGIDSPGLASAPAIVQYVIDSLLKPQSNWRVKEQFIYKDKPIIIQSIDKETRNQWIAKKPLYGNIVCLCEEVSEQEVIDAIHSSPYARTVKSIKKRCRPGSGRCQGSMCEPKIVEILARELQIPQQKVGYDSDAPMFVSRENSHE